MVKQSRVLCSQLALDEFAVLVHDVTNTDYWEQNGSIVLVIFH